MKLKFNAYLSYQTIAINSVIDLFIGQETAQSLFEINNKTNKAVLFNEKAIGNNLIITNETILDNLNRVQQSNNLPQTPELTDKSFSIEMETGTGKTYVYLRTIFELNKNYGFQKFVIIVPNIAVREGVLNSIRSMEEHFKSIYNNIPFTSFVYDSSKLNNVREFAVSNQIKIMIINIQSFQKDFVSSDDAIVTETEMKKSNIINRENDRMQGYKPIEFIQATNPIIIIDEPQSVDNTLNAKNAIAKLSPLITLRYSATHRDSKNLIYRLDPVKAYQEYLVKCIEVASVQEDNNYNDSYIKLIKLDNSKGLRAYVEIHKKMANGIKNNKLWVKQYDDLYLKSNKHHVYQNNYKIYNINCTPSNEYIEFANGQVLRLNLETGSAIDEIMRAQIRITIKEHLDKERQVHNKNIKVLSLFFIDKVASYRIYNRESNNVELGKIGKWFEEEYDELIQSYPDLAHLKNFKTSQLHNGYFSQDNKKVLKDTNGSTKDDENTYRLIMSDKEKLLDINIPLRFIFSHSALKEGWDNPNIFQVCILREVNSEITRRQQIGRGLRLSVNSAGERIYDPNINRLTVIANESYEDFARNLQQEFESEGINFNKEYIKDIRQRRTLKLNKQVLLGEDFKNLWDRIKQRTYYQVNFDIDNLIDKAIQLILANVEEVNTPSIVTTHHKIAITSSGVDAKTVHISNRNIKIRKNILPDIITYLQDQTKLARATIYKILKGFNSWQYFQKNPQAFMSMVSNQIKHAMQELIFNDNDTNGLKYIKIDNSHWDIKQIEQDTQEEIIRYDSNLYLVNNKDKSIFDFIEYESNIEKDFTKNLDECMQVKLFLKIPRWFKISTPIGSYTPDWALLIEADNKDKLYLVRETKSTVEKNNLRLAENIKTQCSKKHFAAINVDFDVTTNLEDVLKKAIKDK